MRTISVKCTNTQHCGHVNTFDESELVSGMTIQDDAGRVIQKHPPVTINENTFVKCSECGYPISCADASINEQS